jgi:hypothetical protein
MPRGYLNFQPNQHPGEYNSINTLGQTQLTIALILPPTITLKKLSADIL